jgi:hypothetical protein
MGTVVVNYTRAAYVSIAYLSVHNERKYLRLECGVLDRWMELQY